MVYTIQVISAILGIISVLTGVAAGQTAANGDTASGIVGMIVALILMAMALVLIYLI